MLELETFNRLNTFLTKSMDLRKCQIFPQAMFIELNRFYN